MESQEALLTHAKNWMHEQVAYSKILTINHIKAAAAHPLGQPSRKNFEFRDSCYLEHSRLPDLNISYNVDAQRSYPAFKG